MQSVFIGSIIKQRRKELKLTQERVCDGICDPVSLSRIENGKQMPSRSIMNALLQRLGLPDTRYYALSSKHELEIEALKKEIVACNVTRNVQNGFEQIEKLKNVVDDDDRLTQQFILRSKAVLGAIDKRYGFKEQIQLLTDAIHLTIPEFDLNEIDNWLYSFDELKQSSKSLMCILTLKKMNKQLIYSISCSNTLADTIKRLLHPVAFLF